MKRVALFTLSIVLTSLGCQDKNAAPTPASSSSASSLASVASAAVSAAPSASASAQPRAASCAGSLVPIWHLEKRGGGNVYARDRAALEGDHQMLTLTTGFFLCDTAGNGLAPLYACRSKNKDLISADEKCGGGTSQGLLGYAAMTEGGGTRPLIQLVNAKTGDHFYAANPDQANLQRQSGAYKDEPFVAAFVWLTPR